ncbi:nitroreductase family protein [Mangrovibrevibacter kandeliae]|uniref:nitroreductase family protein n=1 Tax=Mangrovibrevibacter kandeliae TaxID=2968473 RepID=UPI002118B283|nr:nitroreductase [Aurantimonas sp. CSK15Z-1]MCQ8782692.1 nitroreductase [Aurantimonas sp. CSK15Z-1]
MTDALTALATRRSIPIPALAAPAPEGAVLDRILTIAARVPDHGKLAPWRFILYRGAVREAVGEALLRLVEARDAEITDSRRAAERGRFARAPLVVGVVSTARPHVKIPEWEQVLSAGAAAMNLIHAAHAAGFAANWVTEWVAYDEEAKAVLGIAPDEKVVGFVHIGTPCEPPSERPRPELSAIVREAQAPAA